MWLFAPFLLFVSIFAHEGHHSLLAAEGTTTDWFSWIGSFHLITLHFPIALIVMAAIAELLFSITKKSLYESAAYFMVIMAAIITLPNAILGFLYSLPENYPGEMGRLLTLHKVSGVLTALLAIFTAYVRVKDGRTTFYLWLLALLFALVTITAYFGGAVTFASRGF